MEYFYWTHVRHFPLDEVFRGEAIYHDLYQILLYGCCGMHHLHLDDD